VDVSPVPLKELSATRYSMSALAEFANKYHLSMIQLADLLGYGYRVKAKIANCDFAL